jgi:3-deoxy-manno-octulosonate cytidylyltransferase (CMP-KDO synthetase)
MEKLENTAMVNKMRTVGLIPSRLESSRLSQKSLVDISGLPMVVHVYQRCLLASTLDDVFVATDSVEIAETVRSYGGKTIMTGTEHETGTDRIAEAAQKIDCDIVVNIQGDEALVDPKHIDLVVNALHEDSDVNIAILVTPCLHYNDSDHIKIVLNENMEVMYFSRSDIPSSTRTPAAPMLKGYHIVPFRKDFLLKYASWEKGNLETIEYCEYMRVLEKGYQIKAVFVESDAISVDNEESLSYVRGEMPSDLFFQSYKHINQI